MNDDIGEVMDTPLEGFQGGMFPDENVQAMKAHIAELEESNFELQKKNAEYQETITDLTDEYEDLRTSANELLKANADYKLDASEKDVVRDHWRNVVIEIGEELGLKDFDVDDIFDAVNHYSNIVVLMGGPGVDTFAEIEKLKAKLVEMILAETEEP